MNAPERTRLFILCLAFIVIFYDVTVIYLFGGDAAITTKIREWAHDYPMIPFVIGVIIGHLLWRD